MRRGAVSPPTPAPPPPPVLAELGQEPPREDADREGDRRREGDEDQGSLDRVSDPPVGRVEGEEAGLDRLEAPGGRLEEDAPKRDERDHDASEGGDAHPDVLPAAPRLPVEAELRAAGRELHSAPSPRRRTRRTMSRAKTLMIRDSSIR